MKIQVLRERIWALEAENEALKARIRELTQPSRERPELTLVRALTELTGRTNPDETPNIPTRP